MGNAPLSSSSDESDDENEAVGLVCGVASKRLGISGRRGRRPPYSERR